MINNAITRADYLRVRITVALKTESILHCGDGGFMPVSDWQSAKTKGDKGQINTLCKDKDCKPYIPASTLRGSLREACPDPESLFGMAHGNEGQMGKVRIYDACQTKEAKPTGDLYWNAKTTTTLRDGVSIDPLTNTAAENRLFVHEVVPQGTIFQLHLEADYLSQEELEMILMLLNGWQGEMSSSLGKGRSKGWGQISLNSQPIVEVMNTETINQWMQNGTTPTPPMEQLDVACTAAIAAAKIKKITFKLYPQSPLLINDHALVKEKKNKKDHQPSHEYMRTEDDRAIIPGSSLRGAIRAHMQRILATIAHQHYNIAAPAARQLVTPLLNKFFGTEQKRSLLWINDAIASDTWPHEQTFNAVDRFTGGVAAGALYSVVAAECKVLEGSCTLDCHPQRKPEGEWWKGALLLLIRDILEEDMPVGWGKSRGYGRIELSLTPEEGGAINDFPALMSYLEKQYPDETPSTWLAELHQQIKEHCITATGELA